MRMNLKSFVAALMYKIIAALVSRLSGSWVVIGTGNGLPSIHSFYK